VPSPLRGEGMLFERATQVTSEVSVCSLSRRERVGVRGVLVALGANRSGIKIEPNRTPCPLPSGERGCFVNPPLELSLVRRGGEGMPY